LMARLAYLGTPDLAVLPLQRLVEAGHEIALVVSQPDAKRGRGATMLPTPVKQAALDLGLPVTDDLSAVGDAGVEMAVVVAYGRIIPTTLLERIPMVNLHFSLLPRWRGAAPLERAILEGDESTGVCVMGVEPALDTGPVYRLAEIAIGDKNLATLQCELSELGAELLVALLAGGIEALPEPIPQAGEATYAKKITHDDLELNFQGAAIDAQRAIRLGRAFTWVDDKRLRVLEARAASAVSSAPGTLEGCVVATADGGLELVTVQPEGKRPIEAAAWRRGLRGEGPVVLGRGDRDRGAGPRLTP